MKLFISFCIIFICSSMPMLALETDKYNVEYNKLAGQLGYLTDPSFYLQVDPNTHVKTQTYSSMLTQLNPNMTGEETVIEKRIDFTIPKAVKPEKIQLKNMRGSNLRKAKTVKQQNEYANMINSFKPSDKGFLTLG